VPDIFFVCLFWISGFVFAIPCAPGDFLYLNNEYMILKKKKEKRKKKPPISLILHATWYFFHDASI